MHLEAEKISNILEACIVQVKKFKGYLDIISADGFGELIERVTSSKPTTKFNLYSRA